MLKNIDSMRWKFSLVTLGIALTVLANSCVTLRGDKLASPILKVKKTWRRRTKFESEHFILYMAPGRGEILASYILDELEQTYQEVGEKLNSYPPGKTVCNVFNASWQKRGDILGIVGGPAFVNTGEIYYKIPYSDEPLPLNWLSVFSHEYGHIVFQNMAGTYYLPFEEGFVCVLSDYPQLPLVQPVSDGLASSLEHPGNIKWTLRRRNPLSLWFNAGIRARRLYCDNATIVQFLVAKYGWEKVGEIPKNLRSGMDCLRAIQSITNLRPQELEKEWLTFVSERYGYLSMLADVRKYNCPSLPLSYVWGRDKLTQADYVAGLMPLKRQEFVPALKHLEQVLAIRPFAPGLHL